MNLEDILQRFLDAGMLDVGEDDSKLEQLHAAADDLSTSFTADRRRVIEHTLVALDPDMPPNDPTLAEAESAVKSHWKSFRNRFAGDPRQVLRAVTFEALRIAGEADIDIAAVVWLTGGSYLPFARLGREESICKDLIYRMGEATEDVAEEEWSDNYQYDTPMLPDFKVDASGLKAPAINEKELLKHLAAAAGPSNNQGVEMGAEPNQYWPNQHPTHWAGAFAKRAASGISEVMNDAQVVLFNKVIEALGKSGSGLKDYAAALTDALGEAIESIGRSADAGKRREKLLWWKETLYSHTLRRSYRTLDPVATALVMAYDLHQQVLNHHPQSVEYLLRETMREVIGTPAPLKFLEACERLRSSKEAPDLTQLFERGVVTAASTSARRPLLDYIEEVLNSSSVNAKHMKRLVGLDSSAKIALDELSVWLFRDLQARRLSVQSPS